MPKFTPPKEPQERPGVEVGDEMYFQHQTGPKSGKCLAKGKHGVTLQCDGQHHKVRWEHILGHKKRISQNHKIVEKGEGGAIIESVETGKKMYIAGELPVEDEMNKSILFFHKAIANRPGLALKDETDKHGNQIKRWEKTAQEQKPAPKTGGNNVVQLKPGQRVAFKAGEYEGKGEVVSHGKDGAQVKDGAGRIHNVHHHELTTGQAPEEAGQAEAAANEAAPATGGGNGGGGGQGGGMKLPEMFSPDEIKDLPKEAVQPVASKEAVFQLAQDSMAPYKQWLLDVSKEIGAEMQTKPPEETDMSSPGAMLFIAPVKSENRATEKVESDYNGDWSKLIDGVRASIAVDTVEEVKDVLEHLKSKGLKLARLPKDRFNNPLPNGYRDMLMNVTLPNGCVAELQLHVKDMIAAKQAGHGDYEIERTMDGRYKKGQEDELPQDQWAPDDVKAYKEAQAKQVQIYKAAWGAVESKHAEKTAPKAADSEEEKPAGELNKSLHCNKLILLWAKKEVQNG